MYHTFKEVGIHGQLDKRKFHRTTCENGCGKEDFLGALGSVSVTSGCTKHVRGTKHCKYCGGSGFAQPRQTKPIRPGNLDLLSDSFVEAMHVTADLVYDFLRIACPVAWSQMTAHPESSCRIGTDTINVPALAAMTVTQGDYFLTTP